MGSAPAKKAPTSRRVGDEERHKVAEILADHHAHGRLEQDEFEERLGTALTARTAGELGRLLADLPIPTTPKAPTTRTAPRSRGNPSAHIFRSPSGSSGGPPWEPAAPVGS